MCTLGVPHHIIFLRISLTGYDTAVPQQLKYHPHMSIGYRPHSYTDSSNGCAYPMHVGTRVWFPALIPWPILLSCLVDVITFMITTDEKPTNQLGGAHRGRCIAPHLTQTLPPTSKLSILCKPILTEASCLCVSTALLCVPLVLVGPLHPCSQSIPALHVVVLPRRYNYYYPHRSLVSSLQYP